MRAKIKYPTKNQVEIVKYPCLRISKDNLEVVLFTNHCTGTLVASISAEGLSRLGHLSDAWDMSKFEDFKGEITLSNT